MGSRGAWRARLGGLASRAYPRLDEDYWRVSRWRRTRMGARALRPQAARLAAQGSTRGRPVHLVVVPDAGPGAPTWQVAGGNLFFEVYQSAVEVLGPDRVTLLAVRPEETEAEWHARLLDTLAETRATHVIAQIEADPEHTDRWSWDVVARVLDHSWDGVLVGVMYDSAYAWLQTRARRLGRLLPSLLLADLCVPMDGFVAPGRYDVGPLTMPFSQASIRAVDEHVRGMPKRHEVTFIGTLYEYRVELLEPLRALGLDVVINPHRPGAQADEESSPARTSYLDYMAALAQSEVTINFSLARGGPAEQYKIRVHEASLVGCLCLTDDRHRSQGFFAPSEYGRFTTLESMGPMVVECLSDRAALRERQAAARERAHVLSRTDFWGRIEVGLERRGLPALTGLRPPPPPAP